MHLTLFGLTHFLSLFTMSTIDSMPAFVHRHHHHLHSPFQIHSCIQTLFAMFNVYCLLSASPGSSHFRQLGISFIFVYTGNQIGESCVDLVRSFVCSSSLSTIDNHFLRPHCCGLSIRYTIAFYLAFSYALLESHLQGHRPNRTIQFAVRFERHATKSALCTQPVFVQVLRRV